MGDVKRSCVAAAAASEVIGMAAFSGLFSLRPELKAIFGPKILKVRNAFRFCPMRLRTNNA